MKNLKSKLFYLLLCLPLLNCNNSSNVITPKGINKINHIIIIYLENHSFDNLYGQFPNANGLNNDSETFIQDSVKGKPYKYLPIPTANRYLTKRLGDKFKNLPNKPFNIDLYISENKYFPDLKHKYYEEQKQVDSGKMDRFAQINDESLGLAMGYYTTDSLLLSNEAKQYVLCDNFFHGAFGGSFLNHIWLISDSIPSDTDKKHFQERTDKGLETPDHYVVNTAYSYNKPDFTVNNYLKGGVVIPNQTMPTIGDRLDEIDTSWAWYAGGWDDAIAGHPSNYFAFHHQPFVYFENYSDGKTARIKHLKDEKDFLAALSSPSSLPAICFIKPTDSLSEHPGYDTSNPISIHNGELHTQELIDSIRKSKYWKDAVIIITYDENGGFWDHVPPPTDKARADRWGPGLRVPTIIISPFAKKGVVDHTYYETSSILALIEHRYGLKPLGKRDSSANYFLNAFDF